MLPQDIIAIVDPGHGGSDSGAVANKVTEKSANLVTALDLRTDLQASGIKVYMTRETDVYVSLEDRVALANRIKRENPGKTVIFISVHHNAGGGDRGEYIHSVYRGTGLELANAIGAEMQERLGQQKKVYSKALPSNSNADYYYVIRNTINVPAVIVEVCFLDNINDVQIADTVEEQKRNGKVIASGVLKCFGISSDEVIFPGDSSSSNKSIVVGSKVKLTGARYATGQTIPDWVKKNTYTVSKIDGSKALIKEIVSWANVSELSLVAGGGSTPTSPAKKKLKTVFSPNKPSAIIKELQAELNRQGVRDERGRVLVENGYVGPCTRYAIASLALTKGRKGNITKIVQRILEQLGYSVGKYGCNGVFGDDTLSAVKSYQADWGLEVDGFMGFKTWTSIFNL